MQDISSTQLLHGYQYFSYREEYDRRKAEEASRIHDESGVENDTAATAEPLSAELTNVKTLQLAHGHRRFPGFSKLMEAAELVAAKHNVGLSPSASTTVGEIVRPPSPQNNISSTVYSVVMGLRSSPVDDALSSTVRHSASPSGSDNNDDRDNLDVSPIPGNDVGDDDVDWSAPPTAEAGASRPPMNDVDPTMNVSFLSFTVQVASTTGTSGASVSWLQCLLASSGVYTNEFWDVPCVPDPTLDTDHPNNTTLSGTHLSYEDRVRRKIEITRKKNRAMLWRKITYGLSSKGLPSKNQRQANASLSPKRGALTAGASMSLSRPGHLVSVTSSSRLQKQQVSSASQNDGAPPALLGDVGGTFYGSPPRRVGSTIASSHNLSKLKNQQQPQKMSISATTTRMQQALSGDMPSKHDVVVALSAAKEHFSRVPLRSVFPVVPIMNSTFDFDLGAVDNAPPAITNSTGTFQNDSLHASPTATHNDRLASAGLEAALLSRIAMSVSHADYRLASVMKNAKRFMQHDEPLLLRAWGVTDTSSTADHTSIVSAFPAKWAIVSSAKDPLEVRVAIAWDPFPSMFEVPCPETEPVSYAVDSPESQLMQDAWSAMRECFIDALEDAARLAMEEEEQLGRQLLGGPTAAFTKLQVVEAPRTMWREYYSFNKTMISWLRSHHVAKQMLRRYQKSVISSWEKTTADRNRIESCIVWWRWLFRRRKARRIGTLPPLQTGTPDKKTATKTITKLLPCLHILRCRALTDEDTFTANDPYVTITTTTGTTTTDLYKTPVKEDIEEPSWLNAECVLKDEDLVGGTVRVSVLDEDVAGGDDLLGFVDVVVPSAANIEEDSVLACQLTEGKDGIIELKWSVFEKTETVEVVQEVVDNQESAKLVHQERLQAALKDLEQRVWCKATREIWFKWRMEAAKRKQTRHAEALDKLDKAKPIVNVHKETIACAEALHEGLEAAMEELGVEGHSVTLVGHGSGGTLACAVAVILNRAAANYSAAPSAHSVITVGSPRFAQDDPAAMFEALAIDVVSFGNPTDPALTCPLEYAPSSPGIFHLAPDGTVECTSYSKLHPVPFNAHEHWKSNNIDYYINRLLPVDSKGSWGHEYEEPRPLELEIERGILSGSMEKLKKQSTFIEHGFSRVFVSVLQQLHTSLCASRSSRVSRSALLAATLLMTPPQPIFALNARIPMGRKGLLDFPTFVEWLWSEHYCCPDFVSSFMTAVNWRWDSPSGTFATKSQPRLPNVPAIDPFVPLTVPDEPDDWSFSSAARSALEHMFTHYSRTIPASPFDVHCSGVAVSTYNCLVLLLQHSKWTHACSATRTVDAVLTLLERRHSERPRTKLMNYGGNLTFDGFAAFMKLLVDWFGESYMLERFWTLGYNGLFQHSITRGTMQNVHSKGGPYDFNAEDRWLTRLRHEEEMEFNEWVSEYIQESQKSKLKMAQAANMQKVASIRHVGGGGGSSRRQDPRVSIISCQSSATNESLCTDSQAGDGRKKKKKKRSKSKEKVEQQPKLQTNTLQGARSIYGVAPKLQNWTATGDNSRSRVEKTDPNDEVAVFTGTVETSVGLRLNGPLSRLARTNRRKVLPKLSHQPRVNTGHRMDNLYTNSGVIHLVNPIQRALLGIDEDGEYEEDGMDDDSMDMHVRANRTI